MTMTVTHSNAEMTGENAGGAIRVSDLRVPEAFYIVRCHGANFEYGRRHRDNDIGLSETFFHSVINSSGSPNECEVIWTDSAIFKISEY